MLVLTNKRLNFNYVKVAELKTPDNTRTYYYDTKVAGLGVMVFANTGTKTFFLYTRVERKPKRLNWVDSLIYRWRRLERRLLSYPAIFIPR